jgi:hypothetical protein
MSTEPVNTPEAIRRKIFLLRRAVGTYLAYGSVEDAERTRNEIGELERQIEQINQREREARQERMT